jgi:predicted metal-dependent HD superfamily phosphohydrolase
VRRDQLSARDYDYLWKKWERLRLDVPHMSLVGSNYILNRLGWAYRTPRRAYHNLTHVARCLRQLDKLKLDRIPFRGGPDRYELELALWFHDAVYDATRKDNEWASAKFFINTFANCGLAHHVDAVYPLILATTHQQPGLTDAERLVQDIDLADVGGTWARYHRNYLAIRAEFKHLSDEKWEDGRRKFIKQFLSRNKIYQTPYLAAREKQARANLEREQALLWQQCHERFNKITYGYMGKLAKVHDRFP